MSRYKRRYRPGEAAPVSGVYEAVHADHRGTHEVLLLARDLFPRCRCCQSSVRFRVLIPLWHAREDFDLKHPAVFAAVQ